jgi:hypothetical protein
MQQLDRDFGGCVYVTRKLRKHEKAAKEAADAAAAAEAAASRAASAAGVRGGECAPPCRAVCAVCTPTAWRVGLLLWCVHCRGRQHIWRRWLPAQHGEGLLCAPMLPATAAAGVSGADPAMHWWCNDCTRVQACAVCWFDNRKRVQVCASVCKRVRVRSARHRRRAFPGGPTPPRSAAARPKAQHARSTASPATSTTGARARRVCLSQRACWGPA